MNANTRYLVGCWIGVGLLGAFLAAPMLLGVSIGLEHGQIVIVVITLALAGIIAIRFRRFRRRGIERRVRRLLQSSSPDDLIAYYHDLFGRRFIPNADAFLAHGIAMVYAYYGEFDAARAVLDEIDWASRLPLVRAGGLSVEALLCFLATRNYERGLVFSQQAQRLAEVSPLLPGAATSAAAFAMYVELGEILCGRPTETIVQNLDEKRSRLPITATPLIAWGLSIAYRKMNQPAKAEAMEALLNEVAPYCRGLARSLPFDPG